MKEPRQATRSGSGVHLVWRCFNCQQALARMTSQGIELERPLAPLERKHSGLVAYGLSPRALSGKDAHAASGTPWRLRRLPVVVFCPRPGVCGVKQLLEFGNKTL